MTDQTAAPDEQDSQDRRVLLVHDTSAEPALWRAVLGKGWALSAATSEGDLRRELGGPVLPDLVIVEVSDYAGSGQVIVEGLRSNPTTQKLPVMVVVPRDGERAELIALSDGADEVLRHPLSVLSARARAWRIVNAGPDRLPPPLLQKLPMMPDDFGLAELPPAFMVLLRVYPDGLILIAPGGRLVAWSDEFTAMWSVDPATLGAMTFGRLREVMAEQLDSERFGNGALSKEKIDDLLAGREGDVKTKSGRYLRLMPVNVGLPSVESLQVDCWRDVTEVYTKQDWRLDAFIDKLMNALPYQVYVKDRESRFVRVNKHVATRLGLSDPAQAVGLSDADFYSEPHARRTREEEIALLSFGKPLIGQIHHESMADGRRQWNMSTKVALRDASGAVVGLFGISNDVTTEREHRQAIRDLESFAHSVAHDLRAPTRAVEGFSQLLANAVAELSEEQRTDYLGRINQAAKRMDQIIDNILRLSRITYATLERSQVDFTALCSDVVASLRQSYSDRPFKAEIQEGMKVSADRGLLLIAMTNLLDNAAKYSAKADEPTIQVGQIQRDGETWLYVRDNGVGFHESEMGTIFDQFHRLRTKYQFSGSGIGLATVKRVIDKHNGDIIAKAMPGEGACFYFKFSPSQSPRLAAK